MTLAVPAVTTMDTRPARSRSRCYATIVACTLASLLTFAATADAAVIFEFETTTLTGDPFGEGWFSFPGKDNPAPYQIIGSWPTAPSVFVDFFYTDPNVGVFGLANVASVHFEPAFSMWAFVIASPDNSLVLQGQAGNLTKSIVNGQTTLLAASLPQRVPEPTALLLLGTAVMGFVARRRLSQR
jgi:hypothetical protein